MGLGIGSGLGIVLGSGLGTGLALGLRVGWVYCITAQSYSNQIRSGGGFRKKNKSVQGIIHFVRDFHPNDP